MKVSFAYRNSLTVQLILYINHHAPGSVLGFRRVLHTRNHELARQLACKGNAQAEITVDSISSWEVRRTFRPISRCGEEIC